MLHIYQWLTKRSDGFLNRLLQKRVKAGKEDPARLAERHGIASRARPDGRLIWLHAASIGEAQSALILIKALLKHEPTLSILVTTVTLTSAQRMKDSLPQQAFHQFAPLDHPDWVSTFLDHWKPDAALWMESELWPNMLLQIKAQRIPAALINARLSARSFKRWALLKSSVHKLLSTFDMILAQSAQDQQNFEKLGARNVKTSGNLKYSAAPLPHDEDALKNLAAHVAGRPVCVYASTHKGEEALIMRAHQILHGNHPDFLSIIIPRHPERGAEIETLAKEMHFRCARRSVDCAMPERDTQVYIADTLGELGLFFRLSPIAYIGRSLSDDGGGGHNPIEAAQLNCAILHGPHIQNLQDIYDAMAEHDAAIMAGDEARLVESLQSLLQDTEKRNKLAAKAFHFSKTQSHVIDYVLEALSPLLNIPNTTMQTSTHTQKVTPS